MLDFHSLSYRALIDSVIDGATYDAELLRAAPRHDLLTRKAPMSIDTLATWHRLVKTHDPGGLDALLADDAVFHSPVVHKPQAGKAITRLYLTAAFEVFFNDTFRYVRETVGERDAVLEFMLEIDGVSINGVDMIKWDGEGRITEFKVMLRPLKAVNLIHEKMGAMLQARAK